MDKRDIENGSRADIKDGGKPSIVAENLIIENWVVK